MKPVLVLLSLAILAAGCAWNPDAGDGCVRLVSASGQAVVSLDGGRVLSWKDASSREQFFMPEKPWSPGGDWSHGGTSICWPWFGRKDNQQHLMHGFARNRKFTLRCRRAIADGESVTLGFRVSKDENPYFPYDADLELSVALTDRLSLKLKTTNIGDRPFEITEGLQSYFPVSDYGKIVFRGVEKEDFPLVDGMDKAFPRHNGHFGFADGGTGRGFRLSATGNTGLVVWTPGTVEPANRNLAKDDCPRFIVIGPSSRAAEGAISLKPGESRELVYVLDTLP